MMHLSEQQQQHYLASISHQQQHQLRQQHQSSTSVNSDRNLQHQQEALQQRQQALAPNSTSPSDQSSSISNSITPPHQISSRASPASTALVMSQNNVNQHGHHHTHHHHNHSTPPSVSRQLTPNTNNSSPTNGGTEGSSSIGAGNHPNNMSSTNTTGCPMPPPNPMIRHFAGCHAKSMSAGVVVSVPGISNNLATAAGMNQNNMINNNIAHHRPLPLHSAQQQQHHSIRSSAQHQQQVVRDHRSSNQHHQQLSQPQTNQQHQPTLQYHLGNSNNFISNNDQQNDVARQTLGSSIILSNSNINNIHNRSHSTHLSNVLLEPQNSRNHNYPTHVANSIWSIDENISKSHGKLTASSYISQPYLFNPSITDLSCDNVSNASRLIDGAPASGYYLHHSLASNLANSKALAASGSIKAPEFLPICDLMFNLISMIIYFCENIFGIISLIALYYHASSVHWFLLGALFVTSSNVVCQYLSFRWLYKTKLEDCQRKKEAQEELENEENCDRRFYNTMSANMRNYQCGSCAWLPNSTTEVQIKFMLSIVLDAILHIFCLGFLTRYIKLVIPVTDTARVKKEARDLCMLRMIHGFVQSAPMVLFQMYMICSQTMSTSITSLGATAAILSLLNVCWALASFTKYARRKHMHKFVLTWLGIVSQLFWRLGTISSRVMALTLYAVYYNYWMLVVLALHWTTMFFWLIKPGNLLRDEVNLSRAKKVSLAMATAWIYCFCFINFEERGSNLTKFIYYVIVFIENNVLLTVCLIFPAQVTWIRTVTPSVVYLGFVFGILFMTLYYKYFHVCALNNGLSCSQESIDSIADQLSPSVKKIAGFKPGTLRLKSEDGVTSTNRYNRNISASLHTGSQPEITRNIKPPYLSASQAPIPPSAVISCKPSSGIKKQNISHSHVRRHNS